MIPTNICQKGILQVVSSTQGPILYYEPGIKVNFAKATHLRMLKAWIISLILNGTTYATAILLRKHITNLHIKPYPAYHTELSILSLRCH